MPGDHRLRVLRAADDHPLPPQRPRRLRVLGVARRSDGHAPRAGRSPPPPSTTPSPNGSSTPSTPTRSRWRWPPPTRSPTAGPAAAGPPSWPWNGPATKPNAPNGPSTPANRRTGSSPATSKPAGKHRLAALAEADKTLAQLNAPPCHRCRHEPSLKRSPPTCPRCGTPRPPRPRDRKRLLRTLIADVTLLPEPDFGKARIGIRWHTGATDELVVARRLRRHRIPPHRSRRHRARPPPRQPHQPRPRRPAQRRRPHHRRRPPFDNDAVASLRHYHQIPPPGLLERRRGHRRRRRPPARHQPRRGHPLDQPGMAAARRGLNNQWCIPFGTDVEAACRQRVARRSHLHAPDSTPADDDERTVDRGRRRARHQHQRRLLLDRTPPRRRPPRPRRPLAHQLQRHAQAACRQRVAASVHLKPIRKPQTPRSTSQEAV